MPHNNPFIYGNPVAPDQLIGRKKELRQIAGRIITGQSSIITGSPRSGKTSVLKYLMERKAELFGGEAEKLIFSELDASVYGFKVDKSQFWDSVFKPLLEQIQDQDSPLFKAYRTCQKNHFAPYEFDKFIDQIKQAEWQFVLIIDEFDFLLNEIQSHQEFFAGLRTNFCRPNRTMSLIIATNLSRSQLDRKTEQFRHQGGSPYFNYMGEIILGALSGEDIDKLLHQDDIYFTDNDRCFLKEIAGGHPYLLKTAASILWETYEHDEKNELNLKRELYIKVADILDNIWKSWSQIMMDEQFTSLQKVFISVALVQIKKWKVNFKKHGINIDRLILKRHSMNT